MTPSDCLVTIGVPAYNARPHLNACLDSLLGQNYGDFILLIADNASTDGTDEVCRWYAKVDPRVRYQRHPRNIGMYANLNFLLHSAATPYVKLASADDFWAAEMLTDTLHVLESDPTVELAYPMMTLVDESGLPLQAYTSRLHLVDPSPIVRFKQALNEISLVSQLMGVMRTATVQKMPPMRSLPGEDIPFVCTLSLYGKIFQTSKHQYFRRIHQHSSSFRRESAEHQRRYVMEDGATEVRRPTWRQYSGYISRILASPISASGKAELVAHIFHRMLWNRRTLRDELLHRGMR